MCCKLPSVVNSHRKSIFWCAVSRQVRWITIEINILVCCKLPSVVNSLGGGTGLCADKVPLTPYLTGRLQMFPWCSRVLLWSSLTFLCFPLVLKCFPSAPFSSPLVFFDFPLICLVASFGVNVNYCRKSIFWCAASRQVL